MCGILCVLGCERCGGGESKRQQVLDRARRLRHRGPDWSGLHVSPSSILAHERLSIIDPNGGSQPLSNQDGTVWLCVNGEIYNYQSLRQEYVPNATFKTGSDCEVILHMYEALAEELDKKLQESQIQQASSSTASLIESSIVQPLLNRLNGIFAFVLTDEKRGRYIIARDHIGIVPLYYGRDASGCRWVSSEMKSLHDACVDFEEFPPGHAGMSDTGSGSGSSDGMVSVEKERMTKWYNPRWHDESWIPRVPLDHQRIRTALCDAVKRQLMADVPMGVLLSGGLDSSLIASIAARLVASTGVAEAGHGETSHSSTEDVSLSSLQQQHGASALHSFAIGLEGSPDLAAARVVADSLGTTHHEIHFTVEEGLNAISDVIYHIETYDVTTIRASTPMYLLARKIKSLGVKMVLSGEGADEIFGGYLYFHKCPSAEEHHVETVRKLKALHQFDCCRANKSTAAWGVEARVPFLDKEFMTVAMEQIDPTHKLCGRCTNGRVEKWVLRESFRGFLPDTILWRQKEQFSDGVGYGWIDSLKAHAEELVSDEDFARASTIFPHNPPQTKEAFFIRRIFASHFPQQSASKCVPGGPSVACSTSAAIEWDASFKLFADQSGRSVVGVHNAAYDESYRRNNNNSSQPSSSDEMDTKTSSSKSVKGEKLAEQDGDGDDEIKTAPSVTPPEKPIRVRA